MANIPKNMHDFDCKLLEERAEMIDGQIVYKVQPEVSTP